MAVNRELIAQAQAQDDSERGVLDMDSTESPVYSQQEGDAYNGHFESVCYHALLLAEIERQQAECKQVIFRADAAFAKPEIYEALEERGVSYVIRIPKLRKSPGEVAKSKGGTHSQIVA